MSVTVKRVDGKRHCFFELIVETEDGMTVRVPFNGVELEDLKGRSRDASSSEAFHQDRSSDSTQPLRVVHAGAGARDRPSG